jgi:hypothetical protein
VWILEDKARAKNPRPIVGRGFFYLGFFDFSKTERESRQQ